MAGRRDRSAEGRDGSAEGRDRSAEGRDGSAEGRDRSAEGRVPWLDERQQQAWRSLQVMQARLNAALACELAADAGLSLADYVVLVVLTENPAGSARLFELAGYLGWEHSRASHHIARMAARGLVRKERCATDRRGAVVSVTAAGRRAIEKAAPGHVRAVRRYVVDVLCDDELDALGAAARKIVGAIERAGTDPAPATPVG